jgi:hypothetical protein
MDDSLKEYREELRNLVHKAGDAFEKQINYISAGALGLSMLFVEKVVKDVSQSRLNCLLIFAWILFSLTLLSNLLSHVFTTKIHNKTISDINDGNYDYVKTVLRNSQVMNWNYVSIAFLILGIVLHIIFVAVNI